MTPHYADDWLTVYEGDAATVLGGLDASSVHCCVTSPPYWGLRDYGTATWSGGIEGCRHAISGQVQDSKWAGAIVSGVRPGADASKCLLCGAIRQDSQLGLEATPEEYVANLVGVFREVKRVLRDDGTLWLNLGDSMAAGKSGRDDNSVADRLRMDEHGHGGGVKLQEKGNTGKARKVPQAAYVELRDDLTPEEVAYVLRELSYGTSDR